MDAPRVFERLRDGLGRDRKKSIGKGGSGVADADVIDGLEKVDLDESQNSREEVEERLTILGDTSYGACCVDEVAAEHVDAEVVVHYGRACLSPTARLPVIYVFTTKPLDLDAVVASFKERYRERGEKVCLMADIPYSNHAPQLHENLRREGYENVFATEVIRDPTSHLPNRTLPTEVKEDAEKLKDYSIFHISNPPTALLLILSSRVKAIHIFPTSTAALTGPLPEPSSTALLRRRYALLTRLPASAILGILINTLSVSNYMEALQHCQNLISRAGKKSYVFVVGKVNTAKLANFAEIGAWVVIGCWESSLIESKEFFAPLVTPFELGVALQGDEMRQWGGEWVGDFGELIQRERNRLEEDQTHVNGHDDGRLNAQAEGSWEDQPSDDEPPDFDLKTGRYISRTRPMGRPTAPAAPMLASNDDSEPAPAAPPSSALVQRAKGDVAIINGALSPAAEFLRSKRTWQGLGSDYEVAYERDEEGKIRGAAMEEGRAGVARGYEVSGNGEG